MTSLLSAEQQYLLGFHNIFHSHEEAKQYLSESWERMQVVLAWLAKLERDGVKRVLELGANPYYLTLLMKKHFKFDLSLANYFGIENGEQVHEFEAHGQHQEFRYSHYNVEVDPAPYRDGAFDCVIFCEILEHLLLNPEFAVKEIHRVLGSRGYVILSTPNATRLANLVTLMRGKNIYPSYSPNGIYGRHNREYSVEEVRQLLTTNGFEVVATSIVNLNRLSWKAMLLQALRPEVWRDHVFVLARRVD